jgi:hypothetical protein
MNYAPVTFWYIMPGGRCLVKPDIEGAKNEVVVRREQLLPPVMNDQHIINGADLIVSGTTGNILTQISPFPIPNKPKWYKSLMTWSKAMPGDKVNLRFICNEAGTYHIECSFYVVSGTSRVSFLMNNQSILNGYTVRAAKPELKRIDLKKVELTEGYNELTIKILDSSELKGSNYGIEFLKFKKWSPPH